MKHTHKYIAMKFRQNRNVEKGANLFNFLPEIIIFFATIGTVRVHAYNLIFNACLKFGKK